MKCPTCGQPTIDAANGYKVGDRVCHTSVGDGSVTAIDAQGVHVSYDTGARGTYDTYWFRDHSALLSKI